ncbi:MAG: ATP-binding domain-containing protein [Candidatus Nitrohelix vancouverensis]|uniref:DNA 3'-5' helicase n=1 Tax=Candidatus Nitrohelix vancouverensis TaxID=2705534 RepID=A0A7T0G3T4_9BACT|nr:MAG: ATP-binding domain-containing protein [Candidatus Nitrohelix vancouverensis]
MSLSETDKQLVEAEEALFQKTLQSLFEQLPKAQLAKIAAHNEARELTRQMVNEWNDEARQALVSDEAVAHRVSEIRNDSDQILLELLKEPYFGRIVTEEEDGSGASFLIGSRGNPDAGIVDWRSGPLSALYFNYQQGEEFFEEINGRERIGKIKLRRSYKADQGQLIQIETTEGVFQKKEGEWTRLDEDMQAAAMRSRAGRSKEKRLPSILSLITSEQYEMITTDPHRPVVIQGSAGSGKTTVALHRLAWLLHENNSFASAENTRIIVMNKSLQVYVGATLPSMGIHDVSATTFNSWAFAFAREAGVDQNRFKFQELPADVEEIKSSERSLALLRSYVQRQSDALDATVRDAVASSAYLLAIWEASSSKACLPRLRDFLFDVGKEKLPPDEKESIVATLNSKLQRLEDYPQDIYDLFMDTAFLQQFLGSDRAPTLELLGRRTEKNQQSRLLDFFDLTLILKLIQIKNGGLPAKNGGYVKLDHLVVDEAQDFGPVEFDVLFGAVKSKRDVTIVGDVSQKIVFSRKFPGWDRLLASLGIPKNELVRLEVSYRCTAPIINLARKIEGKQTDIEGRRGSPPHWIQAETYEDLLFRMAEWADKLRKKDPNYLIALICRRTRQAMEFKEELEQYIPGVRLGRREMFSFEPGIMVTNVHQVKGLEFDAVALIDPSEDNYPSHQEESRNLLYVAITRAQDELALAVHDKEFSRILTN